jgi:peptide/nickel transport system substrate-binding protein
MKNKRHWFTLIALLSVAIILVGCGGGETTVEDQPAPAEGAEGPAEEAGPKIFVYGHGTTFPDIDPAISFSNDSAVVSNCYETLTFYNPPGSSEILSPVLATSWEPNADATEWVFKLREGVTFHNGDPFNAEAVKGALENTLEMGQGAAYIWDPVEEIEVVDDYTVKFKLSYAAPLDLIASSGYGAWIYNPAVYKEKGTEWFNEGNCAGTGPYTIESREKGSRLIMTRNENYWGGWSEGQFDKVVFDINEDNTVLQQMIEAGTADFTYGVPPDNLSALDAREDIVVYTNPSFQNLVGLLNTQKPPLDDPQVRKAIAYTVPYSQFIEGIMGNRATQAYGPVPAGMWGFSEDLFQYNYDLDKARELLAQTDYPDGGFELVYTFSSGDLDEQQLGEIWKAELAKLNINLDVRALNWEAQWDLAMSGPENAQDIFVMYWWPDYVSPYSFLFSMFHSEEDILFNLGYYRNPEFDAMIDEANALSGSDRQEAEELFVASQEILIDDVASLNFYDVANIHLARVDIKGYVDNPAYPHVVFVYQLSK